MADHPVGVAQKLVLDALGVQRSTFAGANAYFESIGIVVASKRVGRTSMPVVTIKPRTTGGFTREGEGETWQAYDDLTAEQLAALTPWIRQ
jgi:hypothetical protein